MTEQDLRDLGFKQNTVLPEESGYDTTFWYYTYDFHESASLSLISNDNEEFENDEWYVEIFGSSKIRFETMSSLAEFIDLIERNTIK